MSEALGVVNSYYEACNADGDLSRVPLADDVRFGGPFASVEGAAKSPATLAGWFVDDLDQTMDELA